jgi:hypothetical protein
MNIVRIFGKYLFAFKYNDESVDEFERLFDLWQDVEYLENFFEENKSDLLNGFWEIDSVEEAIISTLLDAQKFEDKLLELSTKGDYDQNNGLESLFLPLYNSQYLVIDLNKSKAKRSWLRIYAIRIKMNAYIVTGGAIKLTATMDEREHTRKELSKLEKCRNFLMEQGLIDIEGVIEETEI